MRNMKVQILAESAIMLALAFALSFVKVIQMPWGGAVTLLSMLPIAIISIRHGVKWGLSIAFIYSLSQYIAEIGMVLSWSQVFISDDETAINWGILIGMTFFDYILAFTVVGFAGAFRKNGFPGQCFGVAVAITLRFVAHFLSGMILWGEFKDYYDWAIELSTPVYSLIYNGAYMFPEILFTSIGAAILFKVPYIRDMFNQPQLESSN